MAATTPKALTEAELQLLTLLFRDRRKLTRQWRREHDQPPRSPAERQQALALSDRTASVDRLRQEIERHAHGLLWYEALPAALKTIPDPPWVLTIKGEASVMTQPVVAIAGSRRASQRALNWTKNLASQLAHAGWWIVSGLALGIDAAAHQGALAAREAGAAGGTLAVLGSGLARPTPLQHGFLAERILDAGGALLSEYAPTAPALPRQFPERNRMVTGLAAGLVVVEAGLRSGTLVSARLALEQGRELMAVPGPPGFANSLGCHALLKDGAQLVENADDVLAVLGGSPLVHQDTTVTEQPLQPPLAFSDERDAQLAQQLYLVTDAVPQSLEALAEQVQAELPRAAYVLTLLELHGWIQRERAGYRR